MRISDITPGHGNAAPSHFFDFNDQLYFLAYHPSDGREFWRLNGGGSSGDSGCVVSGSSGGLVTAALAVGLAWRRTLRRWAERLG